MADTLPYLDLEFLPDVKIECLEGYYRLAAADKMLRGSKKRWMVDLYLDSLSDDLRRLLTDRYDYQKRPDDGEYYVTIRQFQGHYGEGNLFFENMSLGRLVTNENSRILFNQLSKHKKFATAFDKLLNILGLYGGFQLDRRLLGDAAGAIRKIVDVPRGSTVAASLQEIFSDANQRSDQCVIQLSEGTFGSIAALRHYVVLPSDTQKEGLLALPRSKTDGAALHDLASLASWLGFESDKIDEILRKSRDRTIAERALFTARPPDRYTFHDLERCVQQILDVVASAAPAFPTKIAPRDEVRETEMQLKRCGRPNDVDYKYNEARLFLPHMHDEINNEMGEMASTFIRGKNTLGDFDMTGNMPIESEQPGLARSGSPVTMGEDLLLAMTRQELELEQAKHRDMTRQVQDETTMLGTLAQDETSQRQRVDDVNRQIQDQQTRLGESQQAAVFGTEEVGSFKGHG
ncbi:hypothetical protein QQS21_005674 [Conoideocrella luteorostrata]|uniref:Uncharacterized protein n=1 Tax=Conoideocrella luteorostrata TaxID=1105319 RepID=A0AAJ0CRH8_9HYPO|nr:hypothetical protein QQS21_005674 [Conoideocrella luteorostrata]